MKKITWWEFYEYVCALLEDKKKKCVLFLDNQLINEKISLQKIF